MKLLRSYLFAPGNNESLLDKVFRAGADAVVLDLEDAVPESEKERARACVRAALGHLGDRRGERRGPPVFVRINSLASAHWRLDVGAAVGPGVAGIRVPKAESLESLCRLSDAIAERERATGLALGSIGVVATIESARGITRVDEIARGPRVMGFTFGAADFCADVGADAGDGASTLHARSMIVAVSRARRLPAPVAAVFTRLDDDTALFEDSRRQGALGFFGRSAIHPRQVPVIHRAFDPTAEEAASARETIRAYEAALGAGSGATRAGSLFVDAAMVRKARALVELYEERVAQAQVVDRP